MSYDMSECPYPRKINQDLLYPEFPEELKEIHHNIWKENINFVSKYYPKLNQIINQCEDYKIKCMNVRPLFPGCSNYDETVRELYSLIYNLTVVIRDYLQEPLRYQEPISFDGDLNQLKKYYSLITMNNTH